MKIQRNAQCPCGSGKKYKKCCSNLADSEQPQKRVPGPLSQRDCGNCASCCQGWVTTRALGHDIYLGHPCPHTDGHGCTIHAERPTDPCKIFFCAWAEAGSELPEWMQPSQCGVIVLTNRMHWREMPVDILVSAGKDPEPPLIQWFQKRCVTQKKLFVYQLNNQWFGYGPQHFQIDLAAKVARGEALWDGAMDTVSTL